MAVDLSTVKALTFDVFGTVTDWRTTIIIEGRQLSQAKGLQVDWAQFADAWRGGYEPAIDRVRRGELPWMKIDVLHRMILDHLLAEFGIEGLSEAERDHFNRVWHRLRVWPDVIDGIQRLRRKFVVATLSNGNIALLTHMAKHAGLPWDCILSAELARHYKPDPEVYLTAAELLDLSPAQILMVAAHDYDLRGAQAVGFKTAFIPRPLEYGLRRPIGLELNTPFDLVAQDVGDLAIQLGT